MANTPARRGARAKLRAFFEENVGRTLTSNQLREAAGGITEWARRVRELRNEEGMQILTHNDRTDLKPNEYLLLTLERRAVIAREIGPKLRQQILTRNGFTCQVFGAEAGQPSGCDPDRKCQLQIDHVIPISQGGTDDEGNLRAVCVYYNKNKADVIRPASGQAISALAAIRKLPRSTQEEVYRFLAQKFGTHDRETGGDSRPSD